MHVEENEHIPNTIVERRSEDRNQSEYEVVDEGSMSYPVMNH